MAYIYGSDWSDYLAGSFGNDVIVAYGGNDILVGGAGYNDYWGGYGYDWFTMSARVAFSDDLIRDFTFDVDTIDVSDWGISDFGQIAALLTTDAYGNATINAYMAGVSHILTIEGVAPTDLLPSDFAYSAGGAKIEIGTNLGDVLFGSIYGDILSGAGGRDTLLGGFGSDRLVGGGGADYLNGAAGNDVLKGGLGADYLIGGDGHNTFVFNTALGARNVDTIGDFYAPWDTIRLENAVFVGLANGMLAASAYAEGNFSSAHDASARIIYNNANGGIYFDRDGIGGIASVKFADIGPGHASTLGNADFFVV